MSDNSDLPSKKGLRNRISELHPRYYSEGRIHSTDSANFASGPVLRDPTGIDWKHATASGPLRVQTMEGETKSSCNYLSSSADEHEPAQPLKTQ